jgi:DNA-binding XRE family transcriptional regulator
MLPHSIARNFMEKLEFMIEFQKIFHHQSQVLFCNLQCVIMPIHEKIRLLRQVRGLTQEEVADKLNLSVNGYGKIERGNCDINLTRLEQIAEVFGVEIVDLLGSTDRYIFNLSCTNN